MKELEILKQMNRQELTGNFNPSTLYEKGNIFMSDGPGSGEIGRRSEEVGTASKIENPQSHPHEQSAKGSSLKITPERIEQAKKDWDELNGGRRLDSEEASVQKEAIKMGISPMEGGSDTDPNGEGKENSGEAGKQNLIEVKFGQAKWKSEKGDREVVVTGYLGKGPDDKDYVSIEGSSTGIPLDEIEYPKDMEADVTAGGSGGEDEPPKGPPEASGDSESSDDNGGEDEKSEKAAVDNANTELADVGKYKDPLLKGMATGVTVEDTADGAYLQELKQEIKGLVSAGRVDPEEARDFLRVLTKTQRELYGEEDNFRGFYLQEGDKKLLKEEDGPQKWLDLQFEILYDLTLEGQELSSPIISNMQTLEGEASRYIVLEKNDREAAKNFDTVFLNRLNLIQMRTAITYKDIENVKGSAFKLGLHGLLYGLGQEDGKVEAMFNRLQELAQSERLKGVNFHLTPEAASQLQDRIIAEQVDLSGRGGLFEGKTEADIRRTVRIAYDGFVSSHRMGVITARGGHLTGMEAYFSDPIGPFNIYSWEEMLTSKFGLFNHDQQKFLKELKLTIADHKIKDEGKSMSMSVKEKEEYGAKLLRDLFKVPDLFTSAWRVEGMLDSLEERLGADGAKDFALFLRLRDTRIGEEERNDIWTKIIKYKPDEIVGMFREADNNSLDGLYKEIKMIDSSLEPSSDEQERGITVYDKFKDKYSVAIRLLREKGFDQDPPVQIDIANMTDWHKGVINRAMGDIKAGDDAQRIFAAMQGNIDKDGMVDDIRKSHKFAGMLERTFVVDDALLHKMEETEIKKNDGTIEKVTPLSKKFSNEPGGDALVRNWTDHENGAKAMASLIAFIQHGDDFEQNQKDAQAFAEALSQYNGIDERARAYTFTRGTYLKLALQNIFVDGLGLPKLPGRIKTSDIQRIFGPEAKTISRDEVRIILDHEKPLFMGNVKREDLNNEEKIEESWKFFREMEKKLDAKLGGAIKRRGITLLTWIMVFLGMEINEFRKNLTGEK